MTQACWRPRRPWSPEFDVLPSNVQPGDWIRSDLIVRAQHLKLTRDWKMPDYWSSHVWRMVTGEAFLAGVRTDHKCTHMVGSWFQVWQGDGDPNQEERHAQKPQAVKRPVPTRASPVRKTEGV